MLAFFSRWENERYFPWTIRLSNSQLLIWVWLKLFCCTHNVEKIPLSSGRTVSYTTSKASSSFLGFKMDSYSSLETIIYPPLIRGYPSEDTFGEKTHTHTQTTRSTLRHKPFQGYFIPVFDVLTSCCRGCDGTWNNMWPLSTSALSKHRVGVKSPVIDFLTEQRQQRHIDALCFH